MARPGRESPRMLNSEVGAAEEAEAPDREPVGRSVGPAQSERRKSARGCCRSALKVVAISSEGRDEPREGGGGGARHAGRSKLCVTIGGALLLGHKRADYRSL
jgi:hypothetical protein